VRLRTQYFLLRSGDLCHNMIVSNTKLREVRTAIERQCYGGEIILRGPSGSGKATVLEHACKELEYRIMKYTGVNGDLTEFFGSCLRLATTDPTQAVAFCPGADSLDFYCRHFDQFRNFPFCKVFSVPEDSMACYVALQKLPNTTCISFNAFSETALTRGLLRSVDSSRHELALSIFRGCAGDVRQARNQLYAAGVLVDHKENTMTIVRKRKQHVVVDKQIKESDAKDSNYSFYHILGKILYNKDGTVENVDKLANDPVMLGAGLSPVDWIQENVVDFVTDVDTLLPIYQTVTGVDAWMARGVETESVAIHLVFKATCIREPSQNVTTVKRGFRPFRKPSLYPCSARAMETRSQLGKLKDEGLLWVRPWSLQLSLMLLKSFHQNVIFHPNLESDPIEDCYMRQYD